MSLVPIVLPFWMRMMDRLYFAPLRRQQAVDPINPEWQADRMKKIHELFPYGDDVDNVENFKRIFADAENIGQYNYCKSLPIFSDEINLYAYFGAHDLPDFKLIKDGKIYNVTASFCEVQRKFSGIQAKEMYNAALKMIKEKKIKGK